MEFFGAPDANESFLLDLYDTIGCSESRSRRDFGKERGLNPIPKENEQKAIEKLASKLSLRSNDNKLDEFTENFSILSSPRVILYEGKVQKKSHNSIVNHTSKRVLFLLNDVLLIASQQSSSGLFSSEKLHLHRAINLLDVAFSDLTHNTKEDNSCAFEIRAHKKSYTFIAESDSDKRVWLEELQSAIFCIKLFGGFLLTPGWRHEILKGTLHAACMDGELEIVKYHVSRIESGSGGTINDLDDAGMAPLHLAAYRGHLSVVEYLIEHDASVDVMNNSLNTPLMLAACKGHDAIVFYLLEMGADLNARNLKDRDTLYMAVLYAHDSKGLHHIIQALTNRGVNLNQVDASGATPLHECAARNLPRPVRQLVDAGADVNTRHGRTGLTPLQIACTVDQPDVETVRSFLDKGAHANWKDAARHTVFDMVLKTHAGRMNRKAAQQTGDMKATLDEVSSFVQEALPILIEIVKKGGRYDEENVKSLRPSFQDAIHTARVHWVDLQEPDYFVDFAHARGEENLHTRYWTPDAASKHCLLCLEKFTYSNRRHHCRSCGALCCALCSSKRLTLKPNKSLPKSPSSGSLRNSTVDSPGSESPHQNKGLCRVCDGCFNRLVFESWHRHQQVLKAKKELEKQEYLQDEMGRMKGRSSMTAPGQDSSTLADTSGAGQAINEAREALEERGQKLQDTAERSEQLREAATEYNKMAKSLLRQQQMKSGW